MPSSTHPQRCQPAAEASDRLDLTANDVTGRDSARREAPLRILYAEDDILTQMAVEAHAEELGHRITVVADGAAALDRLEAEPFDLLLTDMQMPVMDGLSATRELRRREAAAGAPRLPVIMLTGNSMPKDVAAALAAGVDRHVAKPVTAQYLGRAISETLRSAAPRSR